MLSGGTPVTVGKISRWLGSFSCRRRCRQDCVDSSIQCEFWMEGFEDTSFISGASLSRHTSLQSKCDKWSAPKATSETRQTRGACRWWFVSTGCLSGPRSGIAMWLTVRGSWDWESDRQTPGHRMSVAESRGFWLNLLLYNHEAVPKKCVVRPP